MPSENPALNVRAFTPDDRAAGHGLRVLAFSSATSVPYDADEVYVPDHRRMGTFEGDRMLAQACAWEFGQWFLGRRVPMAGIGGVAVLPEARGRGAAPMALEALVHACIEQGDVISTLYPSLPGFYRRLGWAEAGAHLTRRVRTEALAGLPAPTGEVAVRSMRWPDDFEAVGAVMDRMGRLGHGTLDRGEVFQRRFLEHDDDEPELHWVAHRDGRISGYLFATKEPAPPEDGHVSFRLRVRTLAADDHDSWLALWRLVASNAPVCTITDFTSRPDEPLLDHLPTQSVSPQLEHLTWQTRILDAPGAIVERGWPTVANVEVHLHVHDDWLSRNDGDWVLRVANGGAALEPGGQGTVQLDVGTLASLYTGWARPHDLAWQRRITGATAHDLHSLAEAFRAPAPWLDAYF